MTLTVFDRGRFDWSLIVTDGGNVALRKPIPHDGVLSYSTFDRPNYAHRRSEHQLDIEEVVKRAANLTGANPAELREQVDAALEEVSA